ncbi:MAG: sensor histidine kinase [Planctomycetota bacterium]
MSPHGREHAATLADDSGLAVALANGATLLPVSRAGCLAAARAVVAGMAADAGRHAAAWREAAHDPAIAAWLAAAGMGTEPLADLAGLFRSAVVAATRPGRPPAPRSESFEAGMLLDTLDAALTHHALVTRFEQRVAEARLESLRELAYGAGHEINNPLANIAARAQALLVDEREPERRRRLATIVDQAFRARDMIGGLMLFARPPKPEPTETTTDEVLRPVVESLASRATARAIRLEYTAAPAPVTLFVDPTQVGEAVRMLAVNALEAVDDGGRVHLEAAGAGGVQRARIVVGDDGPGMDAETAARACDPFFSGRDAGRGIGLGLPKARRLIESSGGSLVIESRPGRGTRCIVELPAARQSPAPSNFAHVARGEAAPGS